MVMRKSTKKQISFYLYLWQNFNNRFARLRLSHTAQKCDVINV